MSNAPDLRFAVVGLGFGANHARVLSELEGVTLAAVCDPDPIRIESAVRVTGAASYPDFATMFAHVELDAVVVAVPAHLHEEVATAAIDAGCAVLVEKPLAPSLAEGRRIVRKAAAAGVTLMPGHIERFNPAVQELTRRVQAGEVGRVLQITARRMGPMVVGTRDVNVIHDSALHDIDVMRLVLGSEVEHVYAEARADLGLSVEDSLLGVLRFEASAGATGALGTLDVNWLASHRLRDITVRGEKGIFALDYARQTLTLDIGPSTHGRPGTRGWSTSDEGHDVDAQIAIEPKEPLRAELEAFARCLHDKAPPPVSAHDALVAVSICDALTASARSGERVVPQRVDA